MPNQYSQPGVNVHPFGQQYAPSQQRFRPWEGNRHGPLALPPHLHEAPDNYLKLLPRYDAERKIKADEHLDAFQNYMEDLNIQHEDIYMRLFVQSLEGEPRKSFRNLASGSINTWEALESWFYIAWGEKKDYQYYLSEFAALKKTDTENVESFSKRFNKAYSKVPVNIKPLEAAAMVYYLGSFPNEFAIMLRERRSLTLL